MPWSKEQHEHYSTTLQGLLTEYSDAYSTWTNTIQDSARDPSLQSEADKAAAQVNSILQRMRLYVSDLQRSSSDAIAKGDVLQKIHDLATQIAEEKTELAKLRSESITRDEQAHSLNPRATPSPYTNILGLHRTFRDSTRFAILMVSIFFGILAAGSIGYLIYTSVSSFPGYTFGQNQGNQGLSLVGGHRRSHK